MSPVIVQLLSYPCGLALSKCLPSHTFQFGKYTFCLNPGPFTQKEHMLVTVMASVSLSNVYTPYLFVTQISEVFFGQGWAQSLAYQYLVTISMQCLGYGLAGMVREYIVYPSFCIWPSTLATIALNRSLHESNGYSLKIGRCIVTRYRYFLVVLCLYFVWTM